MRQTTVCFALLLLASLFACEKKKLGEQCVKHAECGNEQCITVVKQRVCTKECHADVECGAELSCFVAGSAAYGYCGAADKTSKRVGEVCENSSECDHRLCVQNLNAATGVKEGYCSKICDNSKDCGGSKECGSGIGGSVKFCKK